MGYIDTQAVRLYLSPILAGSLPEFVKQTGLSTHYSFLTFFSSLFTFHASRFTSWLLSLSAWLPPGNQPA